MIYNSFRNTNEVYKSWLTQHGVNHLPYWSKARKDTNSNFQLILASIFNDIEELKIKSKRLSSNIHNHLVDVSTKGFVYPNKISNFIPQFKRNEEFKYPVTVTGFIGNNQYNLKYSLESSQMRFPRPLALAGTHVLDLNYEGVLRANSSVLENVILRVPEDCFPVLEVESGLNDFFYVEDLKVIPTIIFVSESAWIEIPLPIQGITPSNFFLPEGNYRLEFGSLKRDIGLKISLYGFQVQQVFDYQNDISTPDYVSPSIYRLSEDKNHIEACLMPLGLEDGDAFHEPVVHKTFMLLDHTNDSPVEINCLIKERMHPYVWAYSEEEEALYLYDLQDRHAKASYSNKGSQLVTLDCDDIDYRFQEVVSLKTRYINNLGVPTPDRFRLKVISVETNEEFYITKEGIEVAPTNAWYFSQYVKGEWAEHRWDFRFFSYGTFKFILETRTAEDLVFFSEKIINIGYKRSLCKIPIADIKDLGMINDQLVLKTSSNQYLVPEFIYQDIYIDEDTLTVYTANRFDSIEASY